MPGIALLTTLSAALLITPPVVGQDSPDSRVVEQKLRLLETYFSSPTSQRIVDDGNAEAADALSRARGLVVDARDALAAGDMAHAATLANDALRAFSAASRLGKTGTAPASEPQRTRYAELREAIASFRGSLDKAHEAGKSSGAFKVDLATLDSEVGRADELAEKGYYDRANALLAGVYQNAMQAISEARGSETVVYRLEFDTPDDELAYERERFHGNELLLDMLAEKGASEGAKRLARRYADQARDKRKAALAQADGGDVVGAIAAMEEAGKLLGRALRTLGLPYAP